jgi:hypothetical protein
MFSCLPFPFLLFTFLCFPILSYPSLPFPSLPISALFSSPPQKNPYPFYHRDLLIPSLIQLTRAQHPGPPPSKASPSAPPLCSTENVNSLCQLPFVTAMGVLISVTSEAQHLQEGLCIQIETSLTLQIQVICFIHAVS